MILVAIVVVAAIGYGAVSWFFPKKLVAQQFTALGPVDFDETPSPSPRRRRSRATRCRTKAWVRLKSDTWI